LQLRPNVHSIFQTELEVGVTKPDLQRGFSQHNKNYKTIKKQT
jgi:hypothetical protein